MLLYVISITEAYLAEVFAAGVKFSYEQEHLGGETGSVVGPSVGRVPFALAAATLPPAVLAAPLFDELCKQTFQHLVVVSSKI